MVEFPVVDAHVHVWDPARLHYDWLTGNPLLGRPWLPRHYRRSAAGIPVSRMVFVQAAAAADEAVAEAAWVAELAAGEEPRFGAIVADAPLELGDGATSTLERLREIPKVTGVRRLLQGEAADFCLAPDFIRGVQSLAKQDLSFDICIKGDAQFESVLALVRQCPNVRFVLDHLGKPDVRGGRIEPWRCYLSELAAMPNTWCKLSGLVTEADPLAWSQADLRPYLDAVFSSFGFERVMFGSDWPVVLHAAAYRSWFETLVDAVDGYSLDERRRLFHDNAIAFYRIDT